MYADLADFLSLMIDKVTGRHLSYCRNFLQKTQWMKEEELKRLQTRKLKALLRHVYENVPYYHRVLRDSGFRPLDFNSLEDMRRVPVLKRSALRLKPAELLAQNLSNRQIIACATSGTTATPLRFYQTKEEETWHFAAESRGHGWAGYRPGDKYVHIRRVFPGGAMLRPSQRLKLATSRGRLLNSFNLSEKTMASFALTLQKFKPTYVRAAAGAGYIFATYMLQNGVRATGVRGVFTYGQQLFPHYRRTIENAFGCRIFDDYSSTEVLQIAMQCGNHKGHHVTMENVLVEVEKDGEPAAPGEEGTVIVTSLNSYATPFIRYEIGDTGRVLNDECSCGRGLPLFSPTGRNFEYFFHSDGTFTQLHDTHTVFEELPVIDFQIVQQTHDEIVIKVIPTAGYTQQHTDLILKSIKLRVADIAKVRVELVDSLPLTGFGKTRHFASRIHTDYT